MSWWKIAVPVPLALAAALAGLNSYLLDGVVGNALALLGEDTVYSVQYTDAGFRQVSLGMSEQQVSSLLGAPLFNRPLPSEEYSWIYSRTANDSSFRVRAIVFKKGSVIEIHHEFYVD
jgi:hypothetical protein